MRKVISIHENWGTKIVFFGILFFQGACVHRGFIKNNVFWFPKNICKSMVLRFLEFSVLEYHIMAKLAHSQQSCQKLIFFWLILPISVCFKIEKSRTCWKHGHQMFWGSLLLVKQLFWTTRMCFKKTFLRVLLVVCDKTNVFSRSLYTCLP